jgi:hypothetical protein
VQPVTFSPAKLFNKERRDELILDIFLSAILHKTEYPGSHAFEPGKDRTVIQRMSEAVEVFTCREISLSSSAESFGGRDDWIGQLAGDCLSQVGPFHLRACCRFSAGKGLLRHNRQDSLLHSRGAICPEGGDP